MTSPARPIWLRLRATLLVLAHLSSLAEWLWLTAALQLKQDLNFDDEVYGLGAGALHTPVA